MNSEHVLLTYSLLKRREEISTLARRILLELDSIAGHVSDVATLKAKFPEQRELVKEAVKLLERHGVTVRTPVIEIYETPPPLVELARKVLREVKKSDRQCSDLDTLSGFFPDEPVKEALQLLHDLHVIDAPAGLGPNEGFVELTA